MNKKSLILCMSFATLAVIFIAGIVCRQPIQRTWYLWRLEVVKGKQQLDVVQKLFALGAGQETEDWCIVTLRSTSIDEQKFAADKLAELKTTRGVRHLLKLYMGDYGHNEFNMQFAVDALVKAGDSAIPPLLEELHSTEFRDRDNAYWILKRIDPSTQRILPPIIRLIGAEDKEPAVRLSGLKWLALISLDPVPVDVIELLKTTLRDTEPEIRAAAAVVAGQLMIKALVPELVECLQDADKTVFYETSITLQDIAWPDDSDIDWPRNIGNEVRPNIAALIKALSHEYDDVRLAAVLVLATLGEKAAPAREALMKATDDRLPNIGLNAAMTLAVTWPLDRRIVERLVLFFAIDYKMHEDVAYVFFKNKSLQALPWLLDIIKDGESLAREGALIALDNLDDQARDAAFPKILELFDDKSAEVRILALRALESFPENWNFTAPRVIAALEDTSTEVRLQACKNLIMISTDLEELAGHLNNLLEDSSPRVREAAAIELRDLGSEAAPAIPGLVKCLADDDDQVCLVAAQALGELGSRAANTVDTMTGLLENDDTGIRGSAALALTMIAPEQAAHAAPVLENLLGSDSWIERWWGVRGLGHLGKRATHAIPLLEKALGDEYHAVREAASEALKKIRGGKGVTR